MEEPGYKGGSNWIRLNATNITPQRFLARLGPLTGTPGNKNIPANLRPLLLIVRCYALINSQCLFSVRPRQSLKLLITQIQCLLLIGLVNVSS